MTLTGGFLGGAKSRLLPPSIPFRFFTAAACFHLLIWPALYFGADEIANFRGGPGPALAAIHLLTLGVLTTTAMGASVQLLPVATQRALAAVWPIRLVFWLTVPGIAVLIAAMYTAHLDIASFAAAITTAGILFYAFLLANNLWHAKSLPVVAAYGWAALVSLIVLTGLGLALTIDYRNGFLPNHNAIALIHLILGGFGFMGLLALGFSHVLIPMFALSSPPGRRPSFIAFIAAVVAIVLAVTGVLFDNRSILTSAILTGLAAACVHLWLMYRVLSAGMRKHLGLSFMLVRLAWIMLPATLLVGLAALYGFGGQNGPTLFGFLLIGGWLLTFLLGILQRILPFLASMHVMRPANGLPPLASALASAELIKLHTACHVLAVFLLALAIVADNVILIRIGSATGFVGALAFVWFTAEVVLRIIRAQRP